MTALSNALDKLFIALDNAPCNQGAIAKEADKGIYETYLMFALRKMEAAKYHAKNIENLLAAAKSKALDAGATGHKLEGASSNLNIIKSVIRVHGTPLPYAYELVAFIAAIRSALDFTQVSAMHFKGIKADSVSVLMKLAAKGMKGPLLDDFGARLSSFIVWSLCLRAVGPA